MILPGDLPDLRHLSMFSARRPTSRRDAMTIPVVETIILGGCDVLSRIIR